MFAYLEVAKEASFSAVIDAAFKRARARSRCVRPIQCFSLVGAVLYGDPVAVGGARGVCPRAKCSITIIGAPHAGQIKVGACSYSCSCVSSAVTGGAAPFNNARAFASALTR